MRIGIDIDNTITNTSLMCETLYFKHSKGKHYKDASLNERKLFLDKYLLDIMKKVSLKDGVIEAFDYLNKNKNIIILITRRGYLEDNKVKEITLNYFKQYGLKYDKIYFEILDKGIIAQKEKIDLFIDDHLFNLDSCFNKGIKVIEFGDEESNYLKVDNWDTLLDIIKKEGF